MIPFSRIIPAVLFLAGTNAMVSLEAQPGSGWIEQSNRHTMVLLNVLAMNSPESAARLGLDGYDEAILDLTPGFTERRLQNLETAREELLSRLEMEKQGPVRQDLQILLTDAEDEIEGIHLDQKLMLPYYNMSAVIYGGIRNLLEDRVPPERRQAALVRLRKYAGTEPGYRPVTELAETYLRKEWEVINRIPPFREEVERNLSTSAGYVDELGELFRKYGIRSYERDLDLLREQVEKYNTFIRTEILPKTREDFKLPGEIYAYNLKEYGIDMPVEELSRRAGVAFKELQDQMQVLAVPIAEKHGFESSDYRDVIRSLKKSLLDSASILPFYREQIREIEAIIRKEGIVSLPGREMVIRLATPAESAASPAPFMSPPRLIGNTGEYGEFVLPVKATGGSEGTSLLVDDFLHEAASWALTAHEGRPGHELQYSSMVENGVSLARIIFAMNSVNVEGWALYMEEQMLPYVPIEGQFMILWSRLVRAGRAILDPGLNLGKITTSQAAHVLKDEIVLSDALARSELERYRYRAPGQATSYFNGYLRLMELRAETEMLLGERFNMKAFHDYILTLGLLPPKLIREAVLSDFVPGQL